MSDNVREAVPWSEYVNLSSPEHTWVLEPLIPTGGLANLYGPPKKARKSYFALQLAHAIATGQPFLGMSTVPGKVLYVQVDTPRSLWQLRLRNLVEDGLTPHDNLILADGEQLSSYPFDILKPDSFQWLRQQVIKYRPSLVIFDTLRKAHSASEDKSEGVQQVLNLLQAATQPSALLLISHGRKPPDGGTKGDGDVLHEGRGSSVVSGACDVILRIRPKTKERPTMLDWEGRAVEGAEIVLEDEPNHFYKLSGEDAFAKALADTLTRTFTSENKAAEHLSAITGRPLQTCRSALRRAKGK